MKIKNWEKFQHYKTRRPPWIKFHASTLDDRAIMLLAPFDYRVLTLSWLINSKTGILPDIPDLAFQLRITEAELIESLQRLTEFIDINDSKPLAKCLQVAPESSPETETETETEKTLCSDSLESKPIKYEGWDYVQSYEMFSAIQALDPKAKQPNLEKWASDFRLMRKADKRGKEEIIRVMEWACSDSFWKTNILSPAKLRKQFTQLKVKMAEMKSGNGSGAKYDGIQPKRDLAKDELKAEIYKKMEFVQGEINSGETRDYMWLYMAVGKIIIEFEQRFGEDPLTDQHKEFYYSLRTEYEQQEKA